MFAINAPKNPASLLVKWKGADYFNSLPLDVMVVDFKDEGVGGKIMALDLRLPMGRLSDILPKLRREIVSAYEDALEWGGVPFVEEAKRGEMWVKPGPSLGEIEVPTEVGEALLNALHLGVESGSK